MVLVMHLIAFRCLEAGSLTTAMLDRGGLPAMLIVVAVQPGTGEGL